MNNFYKILFLYLILSGVSFYGYGQTYTYNPSKAGCNGTWGNGNCWDITTLNDPSGCTANASLFPPAIPAGCKVNVVINDDLTITGDLTFDGTYNSISVGNGAKFNITGNVTIGEARQVEFNVVGNSEFNILGELIISLGSNNPSTILDITGDDTANILVGSIDLKGRSIINILDGGRLISSGTTRYNGNSSQINVSGFFRTFQLEIMGGSQHQLNTFGDAKVIIDNDLELFGNSQIVFGGNSEIDIGGNINAGGAARVTATGSAKVYYCGVISNEIELEAGKFFDSCRILPVELLYFNSNFSPQNGATIINWSTAKEWENSHFEIERSEMNIKKFKKIGQVKGIGWTETISSYSYEDKNLPISGGIVYYRLKQVDFNGNFEYSSVVSVNLPMLQVTNGIWRAYPNPTENGQLRVSLLDRDGYNEESLTFRLIHPTSVTESMSVSNEDEMNEILATWVAKIPRGLFVVEIRWGQKVEHIKVLKK
ncbi:hypothetical protein [Aquiflexum lacus]|uniref:hypothetical protein n=1 Tax=Aquiflexum lacus TaxID=2483805 RepID=UPI001895A5CC|nr:hypothetical protein [Aquiflexum lacus]